MVNSSSKSELQGKNILLMIGGGIAAYKALDLIRRLRERGAVVRVILTKAAQEFVTPLSAATLSGNPVTTELFTHQQGYDVGHIRLARMADMIVMAPLTASRMAKVAAGHADDLAGSVLLAARCPILAAPAMNGAMWAHAATKRNLQQLIRDGIKMIGPEWGEMAEKDEAGLGRMSEVADIVMQIEQFFAFDRTKAQMLTGRHVIVTSGPTHEPIDPVRYLANRSSGKQGHAIAAWLNQLGADVTLISGPVAIAPPPGVRLIQVETGGAMLAATQAALPADVAIFVAAVADWRLSAPAVQKIKKSKEQTTLSLELVQNPDILATIAKGKRRPALVIGFAAETADLAVYASEKLTQKGADWIIANDVSKGEDGASIMGGDETQWHIFSHQGVESWPLMPKEKAAEKLAMKIADHLSSPILEQR